MRDMRGVVEVVNLTEDVHFVEKYDGHPFYLPPRSKGSVEAAAALHWFGDPRLNELGWQDELRRLEARSESLFPNIQQRKIRVLGWDYPYGYSYSLKPAEPHKQIPSSGKSLSNEEYEALMAEVDTNVTSPVSAGEPTMTGAHGGVPIGSTQQGAPVHKSPLPAGYKPF